MQQAVPMSLDPFKAIESTIGVNKTAAKIAIGGWIVITLAISLKQYLADDTVTFWQMLVALVALILLMMLLSELPRVVARMTVSFLCLLFAVWSTAGLTQVVTNNGVDFLSHYRCIFTLGFADGCGATPAQASSAAENRGTIQANEPGPTLSRPLVSGETFPQVLQPRPTTRSAIVGRSAGGAAAFVVPSAPVFLLYTGYERDEMRSLAGLLAGAGWNLQASESGGDRIDAARGLNEIRFFHPDDFEAARHLALLVSASLAGRPALELKDLSGTRYAKSANQFEIWISR
jgi:hypothetical protein